MRTSQTLKTVRNKAFISNETTCLYTLHQVQCCRIRCAATSCTAVKHRKTVYFPHFTFDTCLFSHPHMQSFYFHGQKHSDYTETRLTPASWTEKHKSDQKLTLGVRSRIHTSHTEGSLRGKAAVCGEGTVSEWLFFSPVWGLHAFVPLWKPGGASEEQLHRLRLVVLGRIEGVKKARLHDSCCQVQFWNK